MMEFIEQLPLPPDIQRKIFMLSLPSHPCVYEIKHTRLTIDCCECEGCAFDDKFRRLPSFKCEMNRGCSNLEFDHFGKEVCKKAWCLMPVDRYDGRYWLKGHTGV